MRAKLFTLLAVLFGAATVCGQTVTPNIGLQIPAINQNNWWIQADYDYTLLDLLLSGNRPIPALHISGNLIVDGTITGTISGITTGNVLLNPTGNQTVNQPASSTFAVTSAGGASTATFSMNESTSGQLTALIRNVGVATGLVQWVIDQNGNVYQTSTYNNGGLVFTASGPQGSFQVSTGAQISLSASSTLSLSGVGNTTLSSGSGNLALSAGSAVGNQLTLNATASGGSIILNGTTNINGNTLVTNVLSVTGTNAIFKLFNGPHSLNFESGPLLSSDVLLIWPSSNVVGALYNDGSGNLSWNSTVGSVSSVSVAMPSNFSCTGNPITSSGTISCSYFNQPQNYFLASPTSGTGVVTMRAIANADVPPINLALTTNGGIAGILGIANGGTGTASPGLIAGTGVSITGTWPTQTINVSSSVLSQTTIGFPLSTGLAGTNVAAVLPASHNGTVSRCVIAVKSADPSTALTIQVFQNGVNVFTVDPTISGGSSPTTGPGSLYVFTALTSSPLTVTRDDVFTINVTSGNSNWAFTAQLE